MLLRLAPWVRVGTRNNVCSLNRNGGLKSRVRFIDPGVSRLPVVHLQTAGTAQRHFQIRIDCLKQDHFCGQPSRYGSSSDRAADHNLGHGPNGRVCWREYGPTRKMRSWPPPERRRPTRWGSIDIKTRPPSFCYFKPKVCFEWPSLLLTSMAPMRPDWANARIRTTAHARRVTPIDALDLAVVRTLPASCTARLRGCCHSVGTKRLKR